jgi:hypothetical protein
MSILLEHPNSRRHGLSAGVVKRLEKQIKSESVPVFEKLVTWRNLLSFVDQAEEFLIDDEKNSELKAIHRSIIETSIVLGESLLLEEGISQALEQLSCTVDDFKAKLRMLRYQDRMWHSDLDSEKSEKTLRSLFGALP